MASLSEQGQNARTIINTSEPATKPPPIMTTGAVAWVRQNLFRTPFDALLTIVVGAFVFAILSSFLYWAIGQANWFVIIRNIRLFMVGTLLGNPAAVTQVEIITLIVAALVGFSVAAWWRVTRGFATFVIGLMIFMVVFPMIVSPLLPPASTYVTAGTLPVTSGTQVDTPVTDAAFVGMAGDTLTIKVADLNGDLDASLTGLYGFGDRPFANLKNATLNRQRDLARITELESQPESEELTRLRESTAQPVTTLYNVNQGEAQVELINGENQEVLIQGVLSAQTPELTVQLPADGWYVIRKSAPDTTMVLQVTGAYPHFARQVSRAGVDGGSGRQVVQYVRITDGFTIENRLPDGTEPLLFINTQYRGDRPFHEWVSLQFVPFVETLRNGVVWVIVLAITGYFAALLVERASGDGIVGRQRAVRFSAWGWFALPFVIFALIFRTEVNQWGGLFLTFMLAGVGIVASFPLGVLLALGRRAEGLPAIQLVSVMFIEGVRGVPLITVLYLSNLALPLVSPSLGNVPNPVRAMVAITLFSAAYLAENVRGGLQSLPPGQVEAGRALGLNAPQVTLFITLPQALRAVIPALVGQFIALFKDTSLVAIVGLLELTNVALSVTAQAEYDGQLREAFLFISFIYFVFSYAMSYASQRLETSGSGAVMRAKEAA